MKGTVAVVERGGVRVHSYVAPEDGLRVSTQIIETAKRLIIVDAQFGVPYAREAAEVARSIGKPIERVIVTHEHPDHYFGANEFRAPVAALAEVRDAIATHGPSVAAARRAQMGDFVPSTIKVPEEILEPGAETVDGLRIEYERYASAEAPVTLAIGLPEAGALVAQDLVYNRVHLFTGQNDLLGWESALGRLSARGYTTIFPGHGLPCDVKALEEDLDYLAAARQALAQRNAAAYKAEMLRRYPSWSGASLIDLSSMYLFPEAR